VPGGVFHQQAAEGRAKQRADLAGERDKGHGRHILGARNDFHHRQATDGHHHGAADALQYAGQHQLIEGCGLGAKQRPERKQNDGAKEDIAYPHPVRQPAAGRQHNRHRQDIGDDNHMHMQGLSPGF
jgi:hypothetical protein